MVINQQLTYLFAGVIALLVVASIVGFALARRASTQSSREVVSNLNARIRSWWVMCAVFGGALLTGGLGSVVLFFFISFMALREVITLTPAKPSDYQALFLTFFVATPLQYLLLAIRWYGFFSIMIPVYAFLLIPTFSAIAGDTERFLERVAKIQWGLMVCVYCVSYAPALLMLEIPGHHGQDVNLLLFLVLVDQASDVLQYIWGKALGRRPIAPLVSPNKTWEGFVGGVGSATLLGTALWWATPFNPWQAAALSLVITLMGFAGGLTMSAIKRDRGVKDWGGVIPGHGGIMDRIDSLCFAAPIFFHLTRFFFS